MKLVKTYYNLPAEWCGYCGVASQATGPRFFGLFRRIYPRGIYYKSPLGGWVLAGDDQSRIWRNELDVWRWFSEDGSLEPELYSLAIRPTP